MGSVRPVTLVVQSSGDGAAFKQAVALMEMVVHDLEATIQAELARQELARTRHAAAQQEQRGEHLRADPPAALPNQAHAMPDGGPVSHRQQIVGQMLDYLHHHYQRPLQLGDVAAALKMNSSYLCTLFSHTQGVSFHKYLEDLRLAKARELLRDPANRICEVACAAGYASANQFRSVFKAREGVSPAAWRESPSSAGTGPTP